MIYDTLSELLGLDLAVFNPDIVFAVCAVFLLLVLNFFYDLLIMIVGYIGGKRR